MRKTEIEIKRGFGKLTAVPLNWLLVGPVGLLCMAVAKAIGARRVIGVGTRTVASTLLPQTYTSPVSFILKRSDINAERLEFAKSYAATDIYQPVRPNPSLLPAKPPNIFTSLPLHLPSLPWNRMNLAQITVVELPMLSKKLFPSRRWDQEQSILCLRLLVRRFALLLASICCREGE